MISFSYPDMGDQENVIVAFRHRDHIIDIEFSDITRSMLETISAFMEEPLPDLTRLILWGESALVLPWTFLGGSAPRLRHISLSHIVFSTLPTLLTSTRQLVSLLLKDIPDSGYLSPEAMATCLATLPNLERFHFEFQSPMGRMSHPNVKSLPPLTRTDLPALTEFDFRGHSEYLEDLLARIDTSSLCSLAVNLSLGPIAYMSQLYRFITHIERFNELNQATVNLHLWSITLTDGRRNHLEVGTYTDTLSSQISSTAWPWDDLLSRVESLVIDGASNPLSRGDMDSTKWLKFFRLFAAVEHLSILTLVVPVVVPVLRELRREKALEALPALRSLTLAGFDSLRAAEDVIWPFLHTRRLWGRPVSLLYDGE
jgi:hypothetical protein